MSNGLFDNVYNPDVLSCLANLSNDEVFTPPEVVNNMLDMLPQELFRNPDTTFLDPACKTGVFLREIAKRLIVGLEPQFPDLQERLDHIFHNQLYGIAITELTSMLSRRGVYCSKFPHSEFSVTYFDENHQDGNIRFKRIQHTWDTKKLMTLNGKKLGKCIHCGASRDEYDRSDELETHAYEFIHNMKPEEIFNMKFDVIIGNPPYQLSDGGGTGSSAMPLYHHFVDVARKLKPRYISMIIPSRWFAGGKGLDSFRESMLNDKHISKLVDYPNSADCFPGVIIAGGVNYFLWDAHHNGDCEVTTVKSNVQNTRTRKLNEYEVFVRDNLAIDIIRKVKSISPIGFNESVYSRNCFNLISSERGVSSANANSLRLFSLNGYSFVDRIKVSDKEKIANKYKVIMTKAMSGGNKPSSEGNYQVCSTVKILEPGTVCTETYLVLGAFDSKTEAENLENYVKTKFFRFLLLQALTSINISKEKFMFIPLLDFNESWDDERLYTMYNLSSEEIECIETLIKPMDGGEVDG